MLNTHTAKLLYFNSLVLPHFDYCNIIVHNNHTKLQDRLQKLQNRGARIIMCDHYRSNVQQLNHSLKWFTVTDRTIYHRLCMVYKCLNGLAPSNISNIFQHLPTSRSTRGSSANNLVIPRCRLNTGQRSLSYLGAKYWNKLSVTTKSLTTFNAFKNCLANEISQM